MTPEGRDDTEKDSKIKALDDKGRSKIEFESLLHRHIFILSPCFYRDFFCLLLRVSLKCRSQRTG